MIWNKDMARFPDHAQLANLPLMEELYQKYLADPKSVDPSWIHFFEGIDFASFLQKRTEEPSPSSCRIEKLISAYRRFGHLLVPINPIETKPQEAPELDLKTLGFSENELDLPFPALGILPQEKAPLKEILAALQAIYSSRVGFEYMDLGHLEMEKWIQERIEPKLAIDLSEEEKKTILQYLVKAEIFETFIHTKYVGQKRFSLEGNETLIPLLAAWIAQAAHLGITAFSLGMAHRGRLNVLANILAKPSKVLFKEFEDTIEFLPLEYGDVKYHKGYSSLFEKIELYLAANSSCLESVDGIVLGQAKALQVMKNDEAMDRVIPILMHGDAAMSGQGIVYEILEMGQVRGFSVGGTLHIAINNQIGYTTTPEEGRSTRYCTDIAKTFGAPVFHVNAEDPESCIWAAKIALEIRQKFHTDVFIDLNGYRKYGHNETDEPLFTQPIQYNQIRSKQTIRAQYANKIGLQELSQKIEEEYKAELNRNLEEAKTSSQLSPIERFGIGFAPPPSGTVFDPVATAVNEKTLQEIASAFCRIPEGFHIHPKLKKLLDERLSMVSSSGSSLDWGMGECLALASLLWQNTPIRLTGQDSCRGTFSHRHALWFDQTTGQSYAPYAHLKSDQARCDIYNTILSEFGALGYEFGYSWAHPKALICWEAQYGDFVIGAEILIDQYIAAAEEKWARHSSLTLLLPHGYEGAGPEHSSARMERFLQLAARDNIQIANPTTPAQYFHLLRRQALRPIKKPLIVFTPKSLLRLNLCASPLSSFTTGSFEEILDDTAPPQTVKRVLLCTGKIYYELLEARKNFSDSAIIRLEQIYPLHVEKLKKILAKYPKTESLVWVQEEPENMGAWEFLQGALRKELPSSQPLKCVSRERHGSTATGSSAKHKQEQQALFERLK